MKRCRKSRGSFLAESSGLPTSGTSHDVLLRFQATDAVRAVDVVT